MTAQPDPMMAIEDFTNQWQSLIDDELTIEQLGTLSKMLNSMSLDHRVVSYIEGQVDAALRLRKAAEQLADPNRHAFIPDDVDLDNPHCTARDKGGTVCGLPPANGRHQ